MSNQEPGTATPDNTVTLTINIEVETAGLERAVELAERLKSAQAAVGTAASASDTERLIQSMERLIAKLDAEQERRAAAARPFFAALAKVTSNGAEAAAPHLQKT
ncbi:hypothetical protein ACLB1G_21790 [Oxalobacteraceae bacterium A2-2]